MVVILRIGIEDYGILRSASISDGGILPGRLITYKVGDGYETVFGLRESATRDTITFRPYKNGAYGDPLTIERKDIKRNQAI